MAAETPRTATTLLNGFELRSTLAIALGATAEPGHLRPTVWLQRLKPGGDHYCAGRFFGEFRGHWGSVGH